jgi:hypothetical protein
MSGRLVLVGIVLFFLAAAVFAYTRNTSQRPSERNVEMPTLSETREVSEKTYSNPDYGISFKYPKEYRLVEFDAPGSEQRMHHVIALTHEDNLPIPENSEGPPTITIDMYQNNLDNQDAEEWIRNSSQSNFKLGEMRLATTTVGGEAALSYLWSGLYEGTTIVVGKPDWIYAFSVTYIEMGADIIQDFVKIRDSIQFSTSS